MWLHYHLFSDYIQMIENNSIFFLFALIHSCHSSLELSHKCTWEKTSAYTCWNKLTLSFIVTKSLTVLYVCVIPRGYVVCRCLDILLFDEPYYDIKIVNWNQSIQPSQKYGVGPSSRTSRNCHMMTSVMRMRKTRRREGTSVCIYRKSHDSISAWLIFLTFLEVIMNK